MSKSAEPDSMVWRRRSGTAAAHSLPRARTVLHAEICLAGTQVSSEERRGRRA